MSKRKQQDLAVNDSALPTAYANLAQNLQAAATTVGIGGSGSRGLFMKVDDRTGAVTAGPSRDPVPLRHRYAVNIRSFKHGYVVF